VSNAAVTNRVVVETVLKLCIKSSKNCVKQWSLLVKKSQCKATVILCGLYEFQFPKIQTTQIARPFGGRFYRA
jgi:hypothetical protein